MNLSSPHAGSQESSSPLPLQSITVVPRYAARLGEQVRARIASRTYTGWQREEISPGHSVLRYDNEPERHRPYTALDNGELVLADYERLAGDTKTYSIQMGKFATYSEKIPHTRHEAILRSDVRAIIGEVQEAQNKFVSALIECAAHKDKPFYAQQFGAACDRLESVYAQYLPEGDARAEQAHTLMKGFESYTLSVLQEELHKQPCFGRDSFAKIGIVGQLKCMLPELLGLGRNEPPRRG